MGQTERSVESSHFIRKHSLIADNSFVGVNLMQGTIKSLTEKGFGFITPEGQDKDVFFHSTALVDVTFDQLQVGDVVTFEVEPSEKGPRAVDVHRV